MSLGPTSLGLIAPFGFASVQVDPARLWRRPEIRHQVASDPGIGRDDHCSRRHDGAVAELDRRRADPGHRSLEPDRVGGQSPGKRGRQRLHACGGESRRTEREHAHHQVREHPAGRDGLLQDDARQERIEDSPHGVGRERRPGLRRRNVRT
jgi:hypothetical protein